MTYTRFAIMLIGIIWLGGGSGHRADAQETAGVAAGRRLADTWCSSCHVVGPETTRGTSNGVPTLAAVAQMSSTTAQSLHVFLQTPHANMPDLHLSRNEIDDLALYILSLRHR